MENIFRFYLNKIAKDQSTFLQKIRDHDQNMRNKWIEYLNKYNFEQAKDKFIKDYGTSDNDLFGERNNQKEIKNKNYNFYEFKENDWENYWLIVQHMDNDDYQEKALNILEQFLSKNHIYYKYLYDRIQTNKTGMQTYGTQNPNFSKLDKNTEFYLEGMQRIKELYNK